MSHDLGEISLKVAATRFDEIITQTTRILLLRERRKGNPGEATRQRSMQDDKVGKSPMDGDARGVG